MPWQPTDKQAITAQKLAESTAKRVDDLSVEVDGKIDEVTQQLADKVSQTELEIERARINNLTANAGDTDGNAELIDIRVGFDGVVYATAGEATRAIGNYMIKENQPWEVD